MHTVQYAFKCPITVIINELDDKMAGEYPAGKDINLAETVFMEYCNMSHLGGNKFRVNPACY